jgi:hypothetical protein
LSVIRLHFLHEAQRIAVHAPASGGNSLRDFLIRLAHNSLIPYRESIDDPVRETEMVRPMKA